MASEYSRRLAAASSANRLLTEAGVDQTRQVDVFGLIESLGLWLAFFPLDGLLGAYLPEGVGGILVTTERSTPIQRYTAAHELGHWRLDGGHDGALDSESDVLGWTGIEQETLAQVFAGALLMPPPLVHSILSRRNATTLGPLDVYSVAREAGVSYEASARQLHHLDRITRYELRELLKVQPLKLKQAIGAGRRPAEGDADVWPVDLAWHGQRLSVRTDDEIIISLPENRSTGYRWSIAGAERYAPRSPAPPPPSFADSSLRSSAELVAAARQAMPRSAPPHQAVRRARQPLPTAQPEPLTIAGGRAVVVGDVYLADDASQALTNAAIRSRRLARLGASQAQDALEHVRNERIIAGTAGRRVLGIRLSEPGETQLRLELRNEYSDADPVEEYLLTATVEARREAFTIDQLSDGSASEARDRRRSTAAVPTDEPR